MKFSKFDITGSTDLRHPGLPEIDSSPRKPLVESLSLRFWGGPILYYPLKLSIPYIILIILIFIGCLYHVIQITEVFLKFQTKVDVSFEGEVKLWFLWLRFAETEEHRSSFSFGKSNEKRQNFTKNSTSSFCYGNGFQYFIVKS